MSECPRCKDPDQYPPIQLCTQLVDVKCLCTFVAHAQAHSGERSRYPHEGRKYFKGTEPWSEDVALESSVAPAFRFVSV